MYPVRLPILVRGQITQLNSTSIPLVVPESNHTVTIHAMDVAGNDGSMLLIETGILSDTQGKMVHKTKMTRMWKMIAGVPNELVVP